MSTPCVYLEKVTKKGIGQGSSLKQCRSAHVRLSRCGGDASAVKSGAAAGPHNASSCLSFGSDVGTCFMESLLFLSKNSMGVSDSKCPQLDRFVNSPVCKPQEVIARST